MSLTAVEEHPLFQQRDIVLHVAEYLSLQETAKLSQVGKRLYATLNARMTRFYCESQHMARLNKLQVHWICLQENPRKCVAKVVAATDKLRRLEVAKSCLGNGTGCDFLPAGAWLAGSFYDFRRYIQAFPNLDEHGRAALYKYSRQDFCGAYIGAHKRDPFLVQLAVDFVLRGWLEWIENDQGREKIIVQLVADLAAFSLERSGEALGRVMELVGKQPEVLNQCLSKFFSTDAKPSAQCPVVLETLLKNGADVNACRDGDRSVGERALNSGLINEKVRAALRVCVKYGDRTLHKQALKQLQKNAERMEVLEFLHEVGAYQVGMRDEKGEGALHYLLRNHSSEVCVIQWALDLGEDADTRNKAGVSPLQLALTHHLGRDLKLILDVLRQCNVDPHPVTANGSTTLHLLCQTRIVLGVEHFAWVIGLCGGVLAADKEGKRPLDYLADQCTQNPIRWGPIVRLFIAEGETFWEEDGSFKRWSAENAFLLAVAGGCLDQLRQWPTENLPLEHSYCRNFREQLYPAHLAARNADVKTLQWLADRGAKLEHEPNVPSLVYALVEGFDCSTHEADVLAVIRFLGQRTELLTDRYPKLIEKLIAAGMYESVFEIAEMVAVEPGTIKPFDTRWEQCDEATAEKLLRWLTKVAPNWKPHMVGIFAAYGSRAAALITRVNQRWLLFRCVYSDNYINRICERIVSCHEKISEQQNLLEGLQATKQALDLYQWNLCSESALATLTDQRTLFLTPPDILAALFELFIDQEQLHTKLLHRKESACCQLFGTIGYQGISKAQWELLRSHLDKTNLTFDNHKALVALCQSPSGLPVAEEYLEVAPQIVEWICGRLSENCKEIEGRSPLAAAVKGQECPELKYVLVRALLQNGFSPKGTDGGGKSALRIACEYGDRDSALLMLDAKPALDDRDEMGLLHCAHENGNLQLLLDLDTHFGEELQPKAF